LPVSEAVTTNYTQFCVWLFPLDVLLTATSKFDNFNLAVFYGWRIDLNLELELKLISISVTHRSRHKYIEPQLCIARTVSAINKPQGAAQGGYNRMNNFHRICD